jgi:DNA-binding response OmpR family regulator
VGQFAEGATGSHRHQPAEVQAIPPPDAADGRTLPDVNTTTRLLVVEDDATIGEPLAEALGREGFTVTWVLTGAEALAAPDAFDLVLLDLGLPDLDGAEVCRRLRTRSTVPIIVLTARDDDVERVLLLETGADDYVLKPFGFRELVARIRAVRRRSQLAAAPAPEPAPATPASTAGLTVDIRSRRVLLEGTEIDLTPKEFDLLALLATEPGRAFSREHIIHDVWDEHWWGPTKTLDVHISALRKKLGPKPWITTLRGVGYRLDPPDGAESLTVVSDA